ncbi:MAG TPA: DUF4282 domain-containing protein [Streptosporangiaceae bacterium]|nr:DUF4282 domain-containing protein [Streptosporangiaceae bacterium]
MANPPYGPGQPGGWQQPGPPQSPYPPQAHMGYQQQPPAGPRYDNDKGFFGSLFDFSFDNFIATKLVKFLYVLSLILASIAAIVYVVVGLVALGNGSGVGVLFIILAPIIWLFFLVLARLYLELVIVMFKISEDIKDIRDSGGVR